jgi:hypothetical protein
MENDDELRLVSRLAESKDPGEAARGLAAMADAFVDGRATRAAGFGFLDNALFVARKQATHDDRSVRDAVARLLAAVAGTGADGEAAALETAGEIDLQPSGAARSVAQKFFKETGLGA